MASWSEPLEELQKRGVLTGFALLARSAGQSICTPATGPFAGGGAGASGEQQPADAAAAAVAAAAEARGLADAFFFAPADPPAAAFDFGGAHLIVVQRSAGAFCAVSRRRELGLLGRHLPCGVLFAAFAWPTPAQAASAELDRCCAALMAAA